jgi:hypothetical protein
MENNSNTLEYSWVAIVRSPTFGIYKTELFGAERPSPDRDIRQARLSAITPNSSSLTPWDALDLAIYSYPDEISMLLPPFLQACGLIKNWGNLRTTQAPN